MTPASPRVFPDGFLWGTATSSFQVEGAWNEGGKGESIWDRFERVPGRIRNGDSLRVSVDHFHRFRDDLALLPEIGVNLYRFSIAWPRVIPDGVGAVNEAGFDFYRDVLAEVKRHGIRPVVMLYMWDLPQTLQDRGGWVNPESPAWFEAYARAAFERLGDDVDLWITLNEPAVIAHLGYGCGRFAPGVADPQAMLDVSHHLLLAHGRAVRAYRAMGGRGQIGIGINDNQAVAATDRPEDRDAARGLHELCLDWYLRPLVHGEYPSFLKSRFEADGWRVPAHGFDIIQTPTDFVTLNYYRGHRVVHHPDDPCTKSLDRPMPAGQTRFDDGDAFFVDPPGLRALIHHVRREYGLPILIGENGCPAPDVVGVDGEIHDTNRMDYLYRHLAEVHQAIAEGADVRGYIVWSLLDNFELLLGYAHRFGLVFVDYATQQRILKQSARWYGRVIRANALVPYAGPPDAAP